MQASHNLERVSVTFDDDTLLPNGGLAVAALLAQKLGIADLVDEHVTIDGEAGANGGAKAATVVGSALAGGDCIDDAAQLRAGAASRLFDGVRAPSTVGILVAVVPLGGGPSARPCHPRAAGPGVGRRVGPAGSGRGPDDRHRLDGGRDVRVGQAGRQGLRVHRRARLPPVDRVAGRYRRAAAHPAAGRQRRIRPRRRQLYRRDGQPRARRGRDRWTHPAG
jgi:hypothetical protein